MFFLRYIGGKSQLLDCIEEGLITNKEAKFIQNQLFLELRTGNVDLEALELRLNCRHRSCF